MQLLGKGSFQFEKIKYKYLLETDGLELVLICENLVDKTEQNLIENSELQNSLFNQLSKKYGSSVAQNAIYKPHYISTQTRREMSISFPESEEERLSILASQLIREGLIQTDQEDPLLASYMELKDVKLVQVSYNNMQFYCANQAGIKALRLQLKETAKKLQNSLNELERLNTFLFEELEQLRK